MNYRYVVIINAQESEVEIKTNDVCQAIHQFLHATEKEYDACVCDGTTGEVLCHNGDESYCTTEMGLMVAGYFAISNEEENAEPEEAECVDCECGECLALMDILEEIVAKGLVMEM